MVALLSLCTRRLFSSLLLRFDLGFHRLYQFCELFLAFLSCLCVHVFGYAFAVDSWCEPPLVEVVVYHGDASRTGLTDLALVWLKFRLCGGFRCRLFTCLGWLHALREFGHLRICTADFAVDTNCRLLLHSVGDMAVDVERGLRADVSYHSGERFNIHTVFECHCSEGVAEVVKPHPLAFCAFQYLLKPMIDRRRVSRLREVKRGRENPLAVGSRFQLCQQFCHFGRQQNHAVG